MAEIHLTPAAALARVLAAAEAPSAHILIVVMDRVESDKIRDALMGRVKGTEYRSASNGLLFKTGAWITFLLARNVRPDRLAGNQIALSWAHGLEGLDGEKQDAWLESLRAVTRVGEAPAVLISEASA